MKQFKISPLLYNKLTELFPEGPSNREFNIACEILRYISKKSFLNYGDDSNFVEFGIRLLRIKFSSRANSILQLLKKEGILECYSSKSSKESYVIKEFIRESTGNKNAKGICKKYRISSLYSYTNYISNSLLSSKSNEYYPLLCTEGTILNYKPVTKRNSGKIRTEEEVKMYNEFIEVLDSLEVDYEKLIDEIKNKIKNTTMSSFKFKNKIKEEKFEVTFLTSGRKKWITKKKANSIAKFNYESLIKDGKNYYIGGKEQFLEYKKRNMLYSYMDSIERLKEGDLYAKRNATNGRLDTNFTNMPSFLLKEIMNQNNLVSIDLANSQFAILAYKMEKEGYDSTDFRRFKESAYNGKLYNEATELLGYDDRDETKTGFFESIFSKSSTKTVRKEKLFKLYPTVMEYIDKVKTEGNYKDLSIGLQREESNIFIDQLYPLLKQEMKIVLTKHDSFIVKEDQVEKALIIINNHFKRINFKGKMIKE